MDGFDVKYNKDTLHIVIAKDEQKNDFVVAAIDLKIIP